MAQNVAWQSFLDAVPWFVDAGTHVTVGSTTTWRDEHRNAAEFHRLFSSLAELLDAAFLTPVKIGQEDFELVTFGAGPTAPSWLCRPPREPKVNVFDHHRTLLQVFGGIVERANEPPSWLMSHNSVLTEKEATYEGVS